MAMYRRKQRGAVLLVVVSMLVLFVLIGVTYAIVSSQYRRGARIVSRQKQLGVDPEQHLDSALYQVLRDTRSPTSALRGHSLLRDIYGTSVRGRVSAAANPTILQNKQFLRFRGTPIQQSRITPWNGQWNASLNYYSGCVLTFTSGPLKGTSTRVIAYQANAGDLAFDVMLPQAGQLPRPGAEFVVNGHPFSGAGFGHQAGQQALTNEALKPNLYGDFNRTGAYLNGGAHESYDAVDYQNMALAAVIPLEGKVVPSFHRPALVRYWMNQGAWNQALQRQVIMRPANRVYGTDQAGDHPNFTGSNPAFDPLNPATWDVDNDNDGTPDSIWMDLGMPVQTDASGRKYKPLFALMCVDMDGKLNLNAHGNASHILAGQQAPPGEAILAGGMQSRTLRPAQGFGPGEISFRGICANLADYDFLIKNRYGRDGVPGKPGWDPLAQVKLYQYLFTPQDLRGEIAFGIDHYGQPVFETPARNVGGKIVPANARQLVMNTPYEMNLSQPHQRGWSNIPTVGDTPYSVADLERVMRSNDADQKALPGRLQRIRNSTHLVTTDSYDLPVANGTDLNLALIRSRIQALGIQLPPELQMGLRWNINQALGNGQDDNNNGVIDEPSEASLPVKWAGTPVEFDHDNDGITGANKDNNAGYEARQTYARQIYSLMMAIKNPATLWDTNGDGRGTAAETAQRLAQWAINVVDFRDPDSIMTAFQYDPNPLDGWNIDASSPIVWGAERPELLITETVAFHDRRTQDLSAGGGKYNTDDPNKHDDNEFDQRLRPRGSLFVELYNPWTASNPTPPRELYGNRNGVVLGGAPGGSPTWRMLIVKGNLKGTDPDDWKLADASNDVERSIYFTTPGGPNLPTDPDGHSYQPRKGMAVNTTVPAGSYAVVGSLGQLAAPNTYITPIGRRIDATEDDASTLLYGTTRHIQMTPTFAVRNNIRAGGIDKATADIQPVVGIPIDTLSISEPPTSPPYPVPEGTAAGEPAYDPIRDLPVDDNQELHGNRTLINYRAIYLQRLANPLLPWNATTNPYRTIDSMSVDLSTFNGVTRASDPSAGAAPNYKFFSHERGRAPDSNFNKHPRNLWNRDAFAWNVANRGNVTDDTDTHYFAYQLPNTLGHLNVPYQPAFTARTAPAPPLGKPATFYVGAPDTGAGRPAFPWLTWNNRPFVNSHELMSVPFSSQYQLLANLDLQGGFPQVYQAGNRGDFGHLLNFFDSATGLYRVFEFIQTPSPYTGTETILNPVDFVGLKADKSSNMLHPPFNRISSFRNPGKINLNTIFDARVWNGLWNQDLNGQLQVLDNTNNPVARRFAANSVPWAQFVASRRGYGPNNNATMYINDQTKPALFSNPFRAVSGRNISGLTRDPIESTIMRSTAITGDASGRPLFSSSLTSAGNTAQWNSHFRHQPLQRLSNLTTIRSNVYAVWATVGYFEVEHVGPGSPTIYPDGYRLGQELGWERGEIRRHRAFYMVDRSIPVAFEPGENHNVDRAILLRRFIE